MGREDNRAEKFQSDDATKRNLWEYETSWYIKLIKLEITKGYGVRATTIEGQNAFAPALCFA